MRKRLMGLVSGFVLFAGGCSLNNGLPGDLIDLLASRGISIVKTGAEADVRSRSGLVLFNPDANLEKKIIETFGLALIDSKDNLFRFATLKAKRQPSEMWGISGRPASLKLENGAQLEYLFLLRTQNGSSCLLSEYAYG